MPGPTQLVDPLRDAAASARAHASGTASSVADATGGARESVGAALDDLRGEAGSLLDEALVRGTAAWEALRGEPVGPPAAHRRWPWAVVAAVIGAGAGAVVAYAVSRVRTTDAPDAVEPEQVEAVVDRSGPASS